MEKKKWYTYRRNGIVSVIFLDKVTGERLTAKSTGCRDKEKALQVIHQWYYDPNSFFNKQQQERDKRLLDNLLNDLDFSDDETSGILKNFLSSKGFDVKKDAVLNTNTPIIINPNNQVYTTTPKTEPAIDLEFCPEEIKPLIERIDTLKFTDYILEYWNFKESPYIKQLYNMGIEPPGHERFYSLTCSFKKYFKIYSPDFLLKDIKATNINALLGRMKREYNLSSNTIQRLRNGLTQALHFAYKNKVIQNDIAEYVTTFSKKNQVEKEVFSKEEAKLIANKELNVFGSDHYFMINRLLLTTGCRVGEVLALQYSDIIQDKNGLSLKISKNWNNQSRRIKDTKTSRSDIVPLSSEMALMLLDYTKNMSGDDFLFKSKIYDNRPLAYTSVYKNFVKTMKKIGAKRKGLTPHSYRHTFATRLLEAGYSETQLLFLTRHESIDQLRVYSNHDNAERTKIKQEAINLTENLLT